MVIASRDSFVAALAFSGTLALVFSQQQEMFEGFARA